MSREEKGEKHTPSRRFPPGHRPCTRISSHDNLVLPIPLAEGVAKASIVRNKRQMTTLC